MTKRTFTAADIREIVEVFRNSPEVSAEKFSGMELVVNICRDLGSMSESELKRATEKFFTRG